MSNIHLDVGLPETLSKDPTFGTAGSHHWIPDDVTNALPSFKLSPESRCLLRSLTNFWTKLCALKPTRSIDPSNGSSFQREDDDFYRFCRAILKMLPYIIACIMYFNLPFAWSTHLGWFNQCDLVFCVFMRQEEN